ncbi:MAG TPA: di-heme oxidoredictase family protein [Longimicrobiales bacterium]|nr:di-heme oxidoredictase family protein [Longimicrobiales bacterium]
MSAWTRRRARLCLLVLPVVLSAACAPEPGRSPGPEPVSAGIGEPLPDLTPEEASRFQAGQVHFARRFTPEEGLGPRFNEDACNACHTLPADGGTGETNVTKATRTLPDGRCDLLVPLGGENVRMSVTPALAAAGAGRAPVPEDATHTAVFTIPFLFGLGIVDEVPLETLEALGDPEDGDGDGISGRLGRNGRGEPARFGRKSDHASLADFVEGAFRLEMGLTTPLHPHEGSAGGFPGVGQGTDPTPEPEVTQEVLDAVTDFVRFLAPPSPAVPVEEGRADVEMGRALFESLGCAGCHVPLLRAGPGPVAAISGKAVALHSDLLLHDMGPALEGTCAPGAGTREWRTEPLLGLRYRRAFLHDGRAGRVIDAVLLHGGEAQAARDRFAALDRVTQEKLARFLDTL